MFAVEEPTMVISNVDATDVGHFLSSELAQSIAEHFAVMAVENVTLRNYLDNYFYINLGQRYLVC